MIDTLGIHTAPDKMFAFVDANAADEMRKKVESCYYLSTSYTPDDFIIILNNPRERNQFSFAKSKSEFRNKKDVNVLHAKVRYHQFVYILVKLFSWLSSPCQLSSCWMHTGSGLFLIFFSFYKPSRKSMPIKVLNRRQLCGALIMAFGVVF
jgi:hypothetical protein